MGGKTGNYADGKLSFSGSYSMTSTTTIKEGGREGLTFDMFINANPNGVPSIDFNRSDFTIDNNSSVLNSMNEIHTDDNAQRILNNITKLFPDFHVRYQHIENSKAKKD